MARGREGELLPFLETWRIFQTVQWILGVCRETLRGAIEHLACCSSSEPLCMYSPILSEDITLMTHSDGSIGEYPLLTHQ